jgi:hypothetical protein
MRRWSRSTLEILLAAAICACSFEAYLMWFSTIPLERMLRFVPDDTFYYLQIAENVARHGSVSFNYPTPTSGFHPFWLYAICLVIEVFRPTSPEGLLHLVLALGGTLHVACGLALYRFGAAQLGRGAAALVALAWLVAPLAFMLSILGLETPLYFLLLTLFFCWLTSHRDDFMRSRLGWSLCLQYLGLCAVTAFARSDFILVAATFSLILCLERLATTSIKGLADKRLATIVVGGPIAAFSCVSLYSWWITGSPAQDSGAMKSLWKQLADPTAVPRFWPADWFHTVIDYWLRNWAGHGPFDNTLSYYTAPGWLVVAIAALAVAGMALAVVRIRGRKSIGDITLWIPAVVLILMPLVYEHQLSDIQIWTFGLYFTSLFWLLIGISRHLLAAGTLARTATFGFWSAVIFVSAWGTSRSIVRQTPNLYPWQPAYLESALIQDKLLPADTRVGSFNAGISGFFTHNIEFVDIDGLVNHAAVRAYQQHRFGEFLRDSGIQYIFEEDRAIRRGMQFANGVVPSMTPVASYDLPAWNGSRILYKVDGYHLRRVAEVQPDSRGMVK